MHIRLGIDLDAKFSALHAEYGALPAGLLGKLIVASLLEKPLEEQVEIIRVQMKGKGAQSANRLPTVNTNKRTGR